MVRSMLSDELDEINGTGFVETDLSHVWDSLVDVAEDEVVFSDNEDRKSVV